MFHLRHSHEEHKQIMIILRIRMTLQSHPINNVIKGEKNHFQMDHEDSRFCDRFSFDLKSYNFGKKKMHHWKILSIFCKIRIVPWWNTHNLSRKRRGKFKIFVCSSMAVAEKELWCCIIFKKIKLISTPNLYNSCFAINVKHYCCCIIISYWTN